MKAKVKKKNAKLHKSNKPRYISKAERAKMEAEENAQSGTEVSSEVELEQDAAEATSK